MPVLCSKVRKDPWMMLNHSGIGTHQKPNIVALDALYKQYNATLFPFLKQLKESKDCLETIQKWCSAVSILHTDCYASGHNKNTPSFID